MSNYDPVKYEQSQRMLIHMLRNAREYSIPGQIDVIGEALFQVMNAQKGKPEGVGGTCGCSERSKTYPPGHPCEKKTLRRDDIDWLQTEAAKAITGAAGCQTVTINREYAARLVRIIEEGEAARVQLKTRTGN